MMRVKSFNIIMRFFLQRSTHFLLPSTKKLTVYEMWQYTTAGMKVNWEPLLQRGKELYARLYTRILTYFKFVPSSGKNGLIFPRKKPLQMFGFPQDLHDIYFVSCGIFTIAYDQKHYSLKDLFLSN